MHKFRDYAYDWIAWAIYAAVTATVFWQCATSLTDQGVAGGGAMQNAAFFPRVVAAIMAFLLVVSAMRLLAGRIRVTSPFAVADGTRLAVIAAILFVAYLLVLPYAGFHLATPLLCFVLFALLGIRLVPAFVGGVVLSLAIAFIFEALLNVILPVGVFNIALFN
ncbi:tripartite tricarboxylate transporter TctB family protein [Consotaella aegiceratis]|uniref:tripartite tricarboxylate transporter TctB family protein n=1 Tax=Consotaella aegiceratis TaxID=3097961 RepID=UPI002F3FEAAB